jgi:ParB family chromosome partitioning protein
MIKKYEGADWGAKQTKPELEQAPIKAKTAPGAEFQRVQVAKSNMLLENEHLKAQVAEWDGSLPSRKIPTALIVDSKYANRHQSNFDGEAFKAFAEEIKNAGGNVQPIKVRPIANGKFEVVFGHRRVEACRQAKLDVLAMVEDCDDAQLFVEMDRENRSRKDLSAWEQGVMYQHALNEGLFPSLRVMAKELGIDHGNISKAIAIAELPIEIINAFQSPLELVFRWSKPLRDAFNADSNGLLERAKILAALPIKKTGADVFKELTGQSVGEGAVSSSAAVEPIDVNLNNTKIATIRQGKKGQTEVHFKTTLDKSKTQALAQLIEKFMAT